MNKKSKSPTLAEYVFDTSQYKVIPNWHYEKMFKSDYLTQLYKHLSDVEEQTEKEQPTDIEKAMMELL